MPSEMEIGSVPPVDSEVARRITEYYSRPASELPPADPDEMDINVRDIIRAAENKQAISRADITQVTPS